MNHAPQFEIPIIVTHRNNLPCIEMRRVTTDLEIIKIIVSCAFHGKPIVILPKFKDTLKSLANLQEKGVLFKEGDQYHFTF